MENKPLEIIDGRIVLQQAKSDAAARFISLVFGWMSIALTITAATAFYALYTGSIINLIRENTIFFYGLIIGELLLVFSLGGMIHRMSLTTAMAIFLFYACLNGLTLSLLFLIYSMGSIVSTFLITAGTFAVMALYGYTTKSDLTKLGNLLFMALIGLILASLVNYFLNSSTLYWITTYAGVLIFTGLVAYDTQKIKEMHTAVEEGSETYTKMAIIGALKLYLDFINLFIYLLRIFGSRKN